MRDSQLPRPRASWKEWILVVCFFFISFIEMGIVKSFSVVLTDLVYQLDTDYGTLGTVIGLYHGVSFVIAPLVSPILDKIRVNMVAVFAFVSGGSLCLTSVSADLFLFTVSLIISGISFAFVILCIVVEFQRNVHENFALKFGIGHCGNAFGMVLLPILTETLREVYGWRGAILLLGAIGLHMSMFMYLFAVAIESIGASIKTSVSQNGGKVEPTESASYEFDDDDHVDETSRLTKNGNSDRSSSAIGWCLRLGRGICKLFGFSIVFEEPYTIPLYIFFLLGGLINVAWVVFLIPHGVERGFPLSTAVFLAAFGGIGNGVGRIIQGPIIDRKWLSSLDLNLLLSFINCIVFAFDPLTLAFWHLGLAAFVTGVTIGARMSLHVVTLRQYVPPEKFSSAFVFFCLAYGTGEPLGGVMAGSLAQRFTLTVAFMALGGIEFFSFLLLLPIRCTDRQPQPNQGDNLQRPHGTAAAETEVPPNRENAQQPSTPTDELKTDGDGEQPPPNENPIGVNNQQVGDRAPSGPSSPQTVTAAPIIHAPSENRDIPSTSSAGSLNLSGHGKPSQIVLSQLCKPVNSQAKRKGTRKTERAEF
ncbi:monocarboxylate transporter 7-like [Diadema setosum]|uniref:monocarboxylate transporter 7-like n=1 Tax=Diadema setosum TaxID=31175 RepID=UPI003B3B0CBE